jgi:hypothetical protein
MDKFSRTTELDTAGVLNAIEEDTPKKSRRNNIIALAVCFLVAICIWAFVISIDTELYEKRYENVEIIFENSDYKVTSSANIVVVVKGTKNELVDINRDEVKARVRKNHIKGVGEYIVPVECFVDEDVDVELSQSVSQILIKVEEK